jgi:hypothetical protein
VFAGCTSAKRSCAIFEVSFALPSTNRAAALMEWLKHLTISNNGDGILVNNWLQGKHYDKFENGNISFEYNYIDNRKHEIQYSWYHNGKPHYEQNYNNGEQCGKWILYSSDIPFYVILQGSTHLI